MTKSLPLVLALLLTVPAVPAEAAVGDPARGQSLFVSKGCIECHAIRGAGGRVGPDLGRSAAKASFYQIAAAMWNHSHSMEQKITELRLTRPPLGENELTDLTAFLYFLNYFDEPGDAVRGKALFAEKHCIECHAVGKAGGSAGPRLDSLPRGMPPLQIAQTLWNHGPAMVSMMKTRRLEVPTFRGSEIIDLFAFLRTQGQRRATRAFSSVGDPANGGRVFRAKGCAACHAVGGVGASIGPDLGWIELRGSVTQLAGRMWNHWPQMSTAMSALGMTTPVFKNDELGDLLAFLFITRYDLAGTSSARTGGDVYREKRCASCHGLSGEGGSGPSLARLTAGQPKEEVARRMWNHAPEMRRQMASRGIPWPRFTADELAALMRLMTETWTAEPSAAAGTAAPGRGPEGR